MSPPSENPPPQPERKWISSTMQHLLLGIVAACLTLALLPYVFNTISKSPTTPPITVFENNRFVLSHTLDASIEIDRNYQSWGTVEWVNWLNRRETMYDSRGINQRRPTNRIPITAINTKPINTVVIATPSEITDSFQGNLQPYGGGMVWSNRAFPTYLFIQNKNGYRVYRCPPTYIAVKLVNGRPIHLGAYNTDKISRRNVNFPYKVKCTLLNQPVVNR